VFHGSDNANKEILRFVDRAKTRIDSVISHNAPSVIVETDAILQRRTHAHKERNVKFRYVTEITKHNVDYVKKMLSFSEIRHLDGLRGNFEVADGREYVAVASLQEAQSIPQIIFSNIPEIVEQQQFVFDSFWKMATPSSQRIMEIEQGIIPAENIVYSDYHDAVRKEFEMIKNAKKEIQIMYSTVNAFHIQQKGGILQLLREMAEQNENLRISILSPIDITVKGSLALKILDKYSRNIVIQDIAPSISIKIKSLVVDRRESLVMELKHLEMEKETAEIGFSFYSNSESTVLSYASIFEVLYNQSILFDQLKQEESVKNEFINIAAHELRTPIMPILNGMEILEEKLGDSIGKYRHEIDIITRNASRLQNLAESILQVSRIESGTFSLCIHSEIDVHALIAQVIEDVEKKYAYTDKAGKVSIELLPLFDKEDWKTNENSQRNSSSNSSNSSNHRPLYVDCDSQKVAQVIFNLLDNAMKFTFEGKISVSTKTITCKSTHLINGDHTDNPKDDGSNEGKRPLDDGTESNRCVLVSVQDSGIGINSHIKNQLFEKFATKSRQGTGLGLYLSKKIIELHGGKIWYEDPSGRYGNANDAVMDMASSKKTGATFRFAIPMSISKKEQKS
jgi:signal transduction histidine kinase